VFSTDVLVEALARTLLTTPAAMIWGDIPPMLVISQMRSGYNLPTTRSRGRCA
jgi:hypothetical protein